MRGRGASGGGRCGVPSVLTPSIMNTAGNWIVAVPLSGGLNFAWRMAAMAAAAQPITLGATLPLSWGLTSVTAPLEPTMTPKRIEPVPVEVSRA